MAETNNMTRCDECGRLTPVDQTVTCENGLQLCRECDDELLVQMFDDDDGDYC